MYITMLKTLIFKIHVDHNKYLMFSYLIQTTGLLILFVSFSLLPVCWGLDLILVWPFQFQKMLLHSFLPIPLKKYTKLYTLAILQFNMNRVIYKRQIYITSLKTILKYLNIKRNSCWCTYRYKKNKRTEDKFR